MFTRRGESQRWREATTRHIEVISSGKSICHTKTMFMPVFQLSFLQKKSLRGVFIHLDSHYMLPTLVLKDKTNCGWAPILEWTFILYSRVPAGQN